MTPGTTGVGRHFGPCGPELDSAAGRAAAVRRLLEDGDRADLAWLGERFERAELVRWFDAHAGRQLSRRSRAFWAAVLARPLPPPAPGAAELWPLA